MTKVLLLSLKQHDLVGKTTYPVGQVPSLIAEPGVYTMHMHAWYLSSAPLPLADKYVIHQHITMYCNAIMFCV